MNSLKEEYLNSVANLKYVQYTDNNVIRCKQDEGEIDTIKHAEDTMESLEQL